MIGRSRQTVADGLLVVAVFAAAFFYRFNTLGGALGGFTNDEFGYLARGRQIQGGELPFRDFNDPGWFLTDTLAGAAQWLGGYNLRSEALLTVGMLSLGAAITFILARKASGSTLAALLAIVVHIALDARHYNYPKILLYAAGIALAWRYADHPSGGRLAALGGLTGLAFLFRHDNLVYLGTLIVLTIVLVHYRSIRDIAAALATAAAAVALFVVPFLLFLALNGGVTEYFRAALVYVTRDAQRTTFSLPRLSLDLSRPFISLAGDAPATAARINVRWEPISDADRREREERYRLQAGERVDETTWSYVLGDASTRNIQSIVGDPQVEDTHGIDRNAFTVAGTSGSSGFETQLDTVPNATAFLYYWFFALPFLSAVVLWRLRRGADSTRVLRDPQYVVPVIVLAAVLNLAFMSRGSTNIRIPDVGVTAAILVAWLAAAVISRDAHLIFRARVGRLVARAGMILVLCLTMLSANGLAQGMRTARDAGFATGPGELFMRARATWNTLATDPSALTGDPEQPDLLRIAGYIRACTAPDDRLFVFGEQPLLYYFSNRLFAGGHAWLLPGYYNDDRDEALIVARLRSVRVPVVLTERRSVYDEDYRPEFEEVHAYLEREYREAGSFEFGEAQQLRVLTRADLQPVRRYRPLDLPCFR